MGLFTGFHTAFSASMITYKVEKRKLLKQYSYCIMEMQYCLNCFHIFASEWTNDKGKSTIDASDNEQWTNFKVMITNLLREVDKGVMIGNEYCNLFKFTQFTEENENNSISKKIYFL